MISQHKDVCWRALRDSDGSARCCQSNASKEVMALTDTCNLDDDLDVSFLIVDLQQKVDVYREVAVADWRVPEDSDTCLGEALSNPVFEPFDEMALGRLR
jgi:hypothetical protein